MKDTNTPGNEPLSMSPRASWRAPLSWIAFAIAGLSGGLVAAACSGNPTSPAEGAESGASEASEPQEPEQTLATGINATVVVSKCPDAQRVNVRTANDAIQRLVGPCVSVPGGRAHFSAKLMPGGRIELASPEGDPQEGVVPTCVLKNRLVHRVLLRNPCTLDVQLDERTVVVARPADADAGAGDAAAGGQ